MSGKHVCEDALLDAGCGRQHNVSVTNRTRDRVITDSDLRYWEHDQDTDRYNRKSMATEGRRATLSEGLIGQHITREVRA